MNAGARNALTKVFLLPDEMRDSKLDPDLLVIYIKLFDLAIFHEIYFVAFIVPNVVINSLP